MAWDPNRTIDGAFDVPERSGLEMALLFQYLPHL